MNGEPDNKRPHLASSRTIGTHNGTFHCDEVLACFMLRQLKENREAKIIRSRDPQVLDSCDIVVDVGGVYDPTRHRYDHHQRTFTDTMNSLLPQYPWVTKLSSAGLIYVHFGRRVLAEILKTKEDNVIIDKLYPKIYENFMEEVDAIDNGISVCPDKPRYLMTTNLSARVGHLNPRWNDTTSNIEDCFQKALALVGEEFLDRVDFYAKCWWPARELVKESVEKRFQVDASGEIVELNGNGYPWKDHLFALEEELNVEVPIKFVLFQDTNGSWRVQAIPISIGSFESRIPLYEQWRGLRDEELAKVSEIPGCIFVHATGFIGGHKTREGALQMAQNTLAKRSQV